jgi:hypothetical protein
LVFLKKYILFLSLIVCFVAYSSCCKKEACLEVTGVPITFYGYNAVDLDTVYTTGYAPGTGFAKVTRERQADTIQKDYGSDTTFALMVRGGGGISAGALPGSALSDEHEWKIYIPALNQTIFISEYGYHSYTCNSCGSSKGSDVRSLSTCSVNGAHIAVDAVMIYK